MVLMIDIVTRYTAKGAVGTLGKTGLQFDYDMITMDMNGTIKSAKETTLLKMESEAFGSVLYNPEDRLQEFAKGTAVITMTFEVPGQNMTMPTKQTVNTKVIRK